MPRAAWWRWAPPASVRWKPPRAPANSKAKPTSSSIPGVPFLKTGAMLTNFHLPRTSLLLLVCAFAGKELALAAYRHAVEAEYRFYSYGDCMLIV